MLLDDRPTESALRTKQISWCSKRLKWFNSLNILRILLFQLATDVARKFNCGDRPNIGTLRVYLFNEFLFQLLCQ